MSFETDFFLNKKSKIMYFSKWALKRTFYAKVPPYTTEQLASLSSKHRAKTALTDAIPDPLRFNLIKKVSFKSLFAFLLHRTSFPW